MPYCGHIENGAVVLDEVLPLPEGTAVTVEPAKQEPGAGARALLDLAGLFPREDLREIEEAVRDFRKMDCGVDDSARAGSRIARHAL